MMINITIYHEKDHDLVVIDGDLNHETSTPFWNYLCENEVHGRNVIMCFENVESLDGSGLAVMSMLNQCLRQQQRQMTVINIVGQPRELLEHLGITKQFNVKHLENAPCRQPSRLRSA